MKKEYIAGGADMAPRPQPKIVRYKIDGVRFDINNAGEVLLIVGPDINDQDTNEFDYNGMEKIIGVLLGKVPNQKIHETLVKIKDVLNNVKTIADVVKQILLPNFAQFYMERVVASDIIDDSKIIPRYVKNGEAGFINPNNEVYVGICYEDKIYFMDTDKQVVDQIDSKNASFYNVDFARGVIATYTIS